MVGDYSMSAYGIDEITKEKKIFTRFDVITKTASISINAGEVKRIECELDKTYTPIAVLQASPQDNPNKLLLDVMNFDVGLSVYGKKIAIIVIKNISTGTVSATLKVDVLVKN